MNNKFTLDMSKHAGFERLRYENTKLALSLNVERAPLSTLENIFNEIISTTAPDDLLIDINCNVIDGHIDFSIA